jgi:hypothetical protein
MEREFRYRGRVISAAEVEFIRQLIAAHSGASRGQLSLRLCEAWQWNQANGAPRDMVCRGLLLRLERAAQIELPPVHHMHRNPPARRGAERGPAVPVRLDTTPVRGPLSALRPLEFRQVRRTPEEALFNNLLQQHHYLGYTQPVGEHLKYLVYAAGRPLACLAWSWLRAIWAPATASSAGRRRRGERTSAGSLTIPAFSCCLGRRCRTWPRTC